MDIRAAAVAAAVAETTKMTTLLNHKSKRELKVASYIPAFSHDFLTPFYDLMMKWAARESTFKPALVTQSRIQDGHRVLDVGCGTATLTILIKKTQPRAHVTGIDADLRILEAAKLKAAKAQADISLDQGLATALPYPDNSFNHVFLSMVLHHLTRNDKMHALDEISRVLKPGGELHIADLAKPHNAITRLASLFIGRLEEASDNVEGLLPRMVLNAGFSQFRETAKYMTVVGTVALYTAVKPSRKADATVHRIAATSKEARYYSSIRRYMSLLAPFYDLGTFFISGLRERVVDFANVSRGSKILDVGTGTGKQAFAFAKRGFDVTGIDLSKDMIGIARKKNRYKNARFQISDAPSLPFEDKTFDLACVSFALHDMIPTIRKKAVEEMVRVTKPHGIIVIVDYALPKNKIARQLIFNFVKLYELYYPEFIRSDLKRLLREAGIEIDEEREVLLGAGRIIKGTKNR